MAANKSSAHQDQIAAQRRSWSASAEDWAGIQEPQSRPMYFRVLTEAEVGPGTTLLDAGCGGGVACRVASELGADVTGVDITPRLLEIAQQRVPHGTFAMGEIEQLPVADGSFDVVTAFSSIMFAADPLSGLLELKRVAKPEGKIAVLVPDAERSDWFAFVGAVMAALPQMPSEGENTLDLADGSTLEALFRDAGLAPRPALRLTATWTYPDGGTALRAMMSPGPMAGAAGVLGADEVRRIAESVLEGFAGADGACRLDATATVVLGVAGG